MRSSSWTRSEWTASRSWAMIGVPLSPAGSADMQKYFTGPYTREVLEGIGHSPTREAASRVNELLERFV